MTSLLRGFAESVERYPTRPALVVDDQVYSYEALADRAALIADAMAAIAPSERPLAGVLAHESITAYTGILGTLAAGRGYVPLMPDLPAPRLADIVARADLDVLIVGQEALECLDSLLTDTPSTMAIIAPDFADLRLWARRHRRHRFLSQPSLKGRTAHFSMPLTSPDALAYLLFTSGTTGMPKGVPVRHRNVAPYIEYIRHTYGLGTDDRVSQTFKLAFDLSVHDMFSTWASGACLYPLPKRVRMAPGRFIRDNELTRWFSVPTLAMTMDRFRQLAPGAFPSLRASLFCGEALPISVAEKWAAAAPNSTVDNLYGPTEATIAITSYRWHPSAQRADCENGVVPLGQAFPDQQTLVRTDDGRRADVDEPGELWVAGSQITTGYWRDPQQTHARYTTVADDDDTIWYRTGDLVRRDARGCLHFLGRRDDQIQLQGHRVELTEIDAALRRACGHELAIAVAWPHGLEEVGGIVGFVACDAPLDSEGLRTKCRQLLPDYMVPSRIIGVEYLPKNQSGKLDRKALQAQLDKGGL